jgi:16S rRNA (cytosine1402-N4)-methyltransferase
VYRPTREGVAVADDSPDFGHVPVLLRRCVELLTPALTRHHADGSGAVLLDATLGAGGHAERFLTDLPGL